MMNENKKYLFPFLFLIYLFLIYGFLNGEDAIKGAKLDFYSHAKAGLAFSTNFIETFLNYDEIGMRHSPLHYILRSFFVNNENIFRFLFLHTILISVFFFYKSLSLKYKNKDNLLIYFAALLVLLPTFRSYSIWPDPHLLGFLFFMISIYFYLKFINSENKNNKYLFAKYNTFFLAVSAYCSPNYGLFVIFYLFNFFRLIKDNNLFLRLLIYNFILSIPFFLYLFVYDINFIFGDTEFNIGDNIYSITNISNKIILILSLLLFYQLPLFFNGNIKNYLSCIFEYKKLFFIIFIIYIFLCFNFDFTKAYDVTNSGGGLIYFVSSYFFSSNIFLYFFSFLSLIVQFRFSSLNKSNVILYLCLLLSHPQETLWQANFSPLIFVTTFTIFFLSSDESKNLLNSRITFFYYIYFLSFYCISNFRDLIL